MILRSQWERASLRQEAAQLYRDGATVLDIAKRLEVCDRTIYRWLRVTPRVERRLDPRVPDSTIIEYGRRGHGLVATRAALHVSWSRVRRLFVGAGIPIRAPGKRYGPDLRFGRAS